MFKLYGRKIYCSHIEEAILDWRLNRRKNFRINFFHIELDCDFWTEPPGPKSGPRENHRIQFLDIHPIDSLFKYNCLLLFTKENSSIHNGKQKNKANWIIVYLPYIYRLITLRYKISTEQGA